MQTSLSLFITIVFINYITTVALIIPAAPSNSSPCHIKVAKPLTACKANTNPELSSGITTKRLECEAAESIIDSTLFPQSEYNSRIKAGEVFMNLESSDDRFMRPDDPRLSYTYTEFPLKSFGYILQRANKYITVSKSKNLIDLGSGCGRLCFYAALTLEDWIVHGIEISPSLHEIACDCLKTGMKQGLFCSSTSNNTLVFHKGPADTFQSELLNADLIFCYSTALPAPEFNPEIGAVVLGSEWSLMLAHSCREGCVVITTDRILNTGDGWIVLDRFDVDNPELGGSTVYIHKLMK